MVANTSATTYSPETPRTYDVGGHTVEKLAQPDAYRFICQDCAGHADSLDAYRADDCEVLD